MCEFMAKPTALPQELLATNFARMLDITSCMQQNVPLQATVLRKSFIANFALKALDPRVGEDMASQMCATRKSLLTLGTFMNFVEVDHLVLTEQTSRGETLLA